jgi:hypothetical protein
MNWDTVIERKLSFARGQLLLDYGCDAIPAGIPDVPERDNFRSNRAFSKEISKASVIESMSPPVDRSKVEDGTPVVKIHGSVNWLYCDNCRQVFWVHPDQAERIASQLLRSDDLSRIEAFLKKRGKKIGNTIKNLLAQPQLKCRCSDTVVLGTRIATFSYRKALEFPMFQKSWLAAEELLRAATKWVFIGYSLPAADYEFKYLLKRTQLSRRLQPEILVVSGGPRDGVRLTQANYRKFFGKSINGLGFWGSGLNAAAVAAIRG